MAEYIDRNTAIAKVTALEVIEPLSTMVDVKRLLADMPSADVAPVRHGRWIDFCNAATKCSLCSAILAAHSNYCPNCGAKMGGGAE